MPIDQERPHEMDLHAIETVLTPHSLDALPPWSDGDAWLAGGTWLYSEPQPGLRRLIDLAALDALAGPPLQASANGLRIAATCTIAALERFQGPWPAVAAFSPCCQALLGSFKVWNTATVGGNVCLALPASPMLALTVALDGVARTWAPGGGRALPMEGFALGPQRTMLAPGELLLAIDLPASALRRRAAVRQASLTTHGRSAALLVATRDPEGAFNLVIAASTPRPLRLSWHTPPLPALLDATLAGLPPDAWYDDLHGAPAWRRHMTRRLAVELLQELA